ncbi:hypothetical protein [Halorussus halobius]|uniref:hypothetical protein n=1 Tax=Halorussus halobius TaxID=1710537 RepID=UPI001091D0F9|nr:hypothetical protein [Halorussus halobius]
MTESLHPAVDWTLDQLASVVDDVESTYTLDSGDSVRVKRVDRDNSVVYEGSESVDMTQPLHKRKAQLKTGCFLGASYVDSGGSLAGTEPLRETDVVVNVRVEGMTERKYGHVDPSGADGVPFSNGDTGLVDRVTDALWSKLQYPGVDDSRVSYRYLEVDEDPQSVDWQDFYRASLDVTFHGYEQLGP